jgi:hypothetical protein
MNGQEQSQCKLTITIDLTEAVPWVKTQGMGLPPISRLVGFYDPDQEEWTFNFDKGCLKVKEAIKDSI